LTTNCFIEQKCLDLYLENATFYLDGPDKKRQGPKSPKTLLSMFRNYFFGIYSIMLTNCFSKMAKKVKNKSPPPFLKNGHFKNVQF